MLPRPLSQRERDVLDLLLRFDGGEAFAAQLDAIQVVGGCADCPCPGIELRVDPTDAEVAPHDPLVAGSVPLPVHGSTSDCDLYVFHDKGWLSYVECAARDADTAPVFELPPPETVDVYPRRLSY